MTTEIKPISWSISRLKDFEKCKFAYKLKYLDKVPEPERELPKGKSEFANDRGSRIHDAAEKYIRGEGPLIPELMKFEDLFNKLVRLYKCGQVEMEENWALDEDWEIAPWETGWVRLKLDVLVHIDKYSAVVADWKTGKKWGNEVAHAQQTQLYALITFLRYPELEEVTAELIYLDVDEISTQTFTRDQALRFRAGFDKRGRALTTATAFPANPNKFTCQWCLYGPEHSGHCAVGVRKA